MHNSPPWPLESASSTMAYAFVYIKYIFIFRGTLSIECAKSMIIVCDVFVGGQLWCYRDICGFVIACVSTVINLLRYIYMDINTDHFTPLVLRVQGNNYSP